MTHYGQEVQNRYEAKLQEQLNAMRADFDRRMGDQRNEAYYTFCLNAFLPYMLSLAD